MLTLRTDWQYDVVGPRQHYLVEACISSAVVGRAHGWFEAGGDFVVEKIEIEPSHRSLGYGRHVIDRLRAHARECGCRTFVFKGVRVENEGAIRLYESLGAVRGAVAKGLVSYSLSPP